MRLERVTGEPRTVVCVQCHKSFIAGDQPFVLADGSGVMRQPVVVYADLAVRQTYWCRMCADEMFPTLGSGGWGTRYATGG